MTDTATGVTPACPVLVEVTTVGPPPDQAWLRERITRGSHDEPRTPSCLRVAPLLLRVERAGVETVVVGTATVVVSDVDRVGVRLHVDAAWRYDATGSLRIDGVTLSPEGADAVAATVRDLLAGSAVKRESLEAAVTSHAKTISEMTRNTTRSLREVRYRLEDQLAGTGEVAADQHTAVVSALLRLNVICGRASDQAREAIREGLWVWLTDADAYQSYRRMQDSTLINEHQPATHETRSWMRQHDAAVRQCQMAKRQLDHEHNAILALLSSASSLAVAREADAQSRFNLLVALLSLGLGVPTLVFALYSTDRILPLTDTRKVFLFAPVALCLAVAAALAFARAPRGESRKVWLASAGAVVAVLLMLIVGGVFVPPA